ncbi:MAG TPA: DUF2235 domain-containing protein [Acidobacteriaceae bacterium]
MPKKLILCADGTWSTPHGHEVAANDTNVRKFFCALISDNLQQPLYDSGVNGAGTPIDRLAGDAIGEALFQKIQECYRRLTDAWSPGATIYVFGSSRGAYIARSLGGMIARFGLPTKNLDDDAARRVFAAYREPDPERQAAMKYALEQQYDIQGAGVRMIGVWETVGSHGIPAIFEQLDERRYGLLDTALHPSVQNACQAVSIDDRRRRLEPTLWTNPDGTDRVNDAQMEQVWFAGTHGDVGGGYSDRDLSDISLAWMMRKAIQCGLAFAPAALRQYLPVDRRKVIGAAHDEWEIGAWGPAMHRIVPPRSFISNSVQARLDQLPEYQPFNLNLSDRQLQGYGITDVLG